jgi:two-component system chemotaxis response regulator CheY
MQPNKVLVIDDSKLIHKMFTVLLPKSELVHAMDGREALQRLAEHPDVQLIFLDINMPNMNGLEFLGQVKADAALSQIPVIIVSTEGKEQDTIRGLQAGAAAYVKKPFRNDTILDLVRRVLGQGNVGAAGAPSAEGLA